MQNNGRKDLLTAIGLLLAVMLVLNFIAERWDDRQFAQCMEIKQ